MYTRQYLTLNFGDQGRSYFIFMSLLPSPSFSAACLLLFIPLCLFYFRSVLAFTSFFLPFFFSRPVLISPPPLSGSPPPWGRGAGDFIPLYRPVGLFFIFILRPSLPPKSPSQKEGEFIFIIYFITLFNPPTPFPQEGGITTQTR